MTPSLGREAWHMSVILVTRSLADPSDSTIVSDRRVLTSAPYSLDQTLTVGRCAAKVRFSARCLHGRTEAAPAHEGANPGIIRSANQYGVASRIVDLITMDVTQHPWRSGDLFDAIVTDPPCTWQNIVNFIPLFISSHRWHPCRRETTWEKENPRNGDRTGPNVHACPRVLYLRLSPCSSCL